MLKPGRLDARRGRHIGLPLRCGISIHAPAGGDTRTGAWHAPRTALISKHRQRRASIAAQDLLPGSYNGPHIDGWLRSSLPHPVLPGSWANATSPYLITMTSVTIAVIMIINVWAENNLESGWFKISYTNNISPVNIHIENISMFTGRPVYHANHRSIYG